MTVALLVQGGGSCAVSQGVSQGVQDGVEKVELDLSQGVEDSTEEGDLGTEEGDEERDELGELAQVEVQASISGGSIALIAGGGGLISRGSVLSSWAGIGVRRGSVAGG